MKEKGYQVLVLDFDFGSELSEPIFLCLVDDKSDKRGEFLVVNHKQLKLDDGQLFQVEAEVKSHVA